MKVALTAWGDRVSPVFDSSRTLLIAKIENNEIVERRHEAFFPEMSWRLADVLNRLGIDVMICGAISQFPAGIIENSGIQLISFIGGNVEQVLGAYAEGMRIVPEFSQPGCGWRHGQRKGRNAILNHYKEVKSMPKGDRTGPRGTGPGTGKGSGGCSNGNDSGKPGQGRGKGQGKGQGQGQGKGRGRGKGQGQGPGNR